MLVVFKQESVDLGHLETRYDQILAEDRELFELQAQFLGIPSAGFREPIESDPQKPQFVGAEVINHQTRDLLDPFRFGRLPNAVAFDDRAICVDEDRPADPEPVEARLNSRMLRGAAAANLARGRI